MKPKVFLFVSAVVIAATVGGMATVVAQDKEAQLMDRRDTMKAQGKALQTAKFYSDGRVDQAEAIAAVTKLIATTSSITTKFPPGTGMDAFPGKSGAKPAIWTEWDKFQQAPKAAITEEEKLLALIKAGDKAEVAKQVEATWNDGCQVCHIPYRQKL